MSTHSKRCLSTDDQGRDRRLVDDIVDAMAHPIRDHAPQAAPKRKVRGVLGVLDRLDRKTSNRRFIR